MTPTRYETMTLEQVGQELGYDMRALRRFIERNPDFPPVYRYSRRNSHVRTIEFRRWQDTRKETGR